MKIPVIISYNKAVALNRKKRIKPIRKDQNRVYGKKGILKFCTALITIKYK